MHSGKVVERSAVGQKDCVEMVGRHELPRLFLTRRSFVDRDGLGHVFHGFQAGDRRRQGSARFLGAERRCECGQARARGDCAGLQKAASRKHESSSWHSESDLANRHYRGSSDMQLASRIWKIENETFMETGFQCAGCGEWNQTTVDESAGRNQSYVEDCQVCCKPNVLRVQYDTGEHEFVITAELESL